MIRLQVVSGKAIGQTLLVRQFPCRIGRSRNADLRFEDAGVWENHCRIEYRRADGFYLCPVDGGGTMVGGTPATDPVCLKNGDELLLGALRMVFSLADPPGRGFRLRSFFTWLTLATLVAAQAWLIFALPR